jgi:predicted transcriptional regulator
LKRAKQDIIASILELALSSITQARLMSLSGLSLMQFNNYISGMIDNGLIARQVIADIDNNKNQQQKSITYRTTEKGIRWLALYQDLDTLINQDQI